MKAGGPRILTINSGSSSLKFGLYGMGEREELMRSGGLEGIGAEEGLFWVRDGGGASLTRKRLDLPDHDAALDTLFEWLKQEAPDPHLDAVGHRVVHGGPDYRAPHAVSEALLTTLAELAPLAPDHLPQQLKAILAVGRQYPRLTQIACFDTAFHRNMPEVAQMYPLPRRLWDEGVRRYGFHGLSYEYVMQEFSRVAGRGSADGRVVIAHLGNGASMAAVRDGRALDTTMGFTPAGGLMMGTRSGDLDPGTLVYLLEEERLPPVGLNDLVNKQAGLLGLSGIGSSMKDLLDREEAEPHAAEAVAVFCYQARKFLGAMAAALGGLDTVIFTGGIGENAAPIRWRICQGLEFLGIELDSRSNEANDDVISSEGSSVSVRVMKTDEGLMIARHTSRLLGSDSPS